ADDLPEFDEGGAEIFDGLADALGNSDARRGFGPAQHDPPPPPHVPHQPQPLDHVAEPVVEQDRDDLARAAEITDELDGGEGQNGRLWDREGRNAECGMPNAELVEA